MTDMEVVQRAQDYRQGLEIQAIFVYEAIRRAERHGIRLKGGVLHNRRLRMLAYGINDNLAGQLVRFFN